MITYLTCCFIASICIVATWRLFNDDSSFMSHLTYFLGNLPNWVKKPLYECMFCMSSVWGLTWFSIFAWLFEAHFGVLKYVFCILVIAGMVTVLQGIAMMLDWILTLSKYTANPTNREQ